MGSLVGLVIGFCLCSCSGPTEIAEESSLTTTEVLGVYDLEYMDCGIQRFTFEGLTEKVYVSTTEANIQTATDGCTQSLANLDWDLGAGSVTVSGGSGHCSEDSCQLSYQTVVNGFASSASETCTASTSISDRKLLFVNQQLWLIQESDSATCTSVYTRSSDSDPGSNPISF